jgi:hypothetical protein
MSVGLPSMKPNITGSWRLVRLESNFGFYPPPRPLLDHIAGEDAQGDAANARNPTTGSKPAEMAILGRAIGAVNLGKKGR